LEAGLSSAPSEARGLAKIFSRFNLRAKVGSRPKILDVSCGIGRHSINLAKLGYEVVGYDFSPHFLKTARKLARQEGLSKRSVLRFYEGDTKEIQEILQANGETSFDAIICMDTSIVRPTLKEEIELLRSLHEIGREGSLFVVETANRDSFLKYKRYNALPIIQSFPDGRLQRHLQASYDPKSRHIKGDWKFFRELPNGDLKHLLSIKMESNIHSREDLRTTLEKVGWKYLRSYGSVRRLDRLDSDSFHIVMVAKKA
jgi:2-polyprenyl-3-methyl-5-hydroxy-6-metoxy-1,4-benzoquinol methylase